MLVYSVASRQSFDMIAIIRDKILNHLVSYAFTWRQFSENVSTTKHKSLRASKGTSWVPMVIVGNKCDLKTDLRQVTTAQGTKLAEEFNCSFTEASARENTNVSNAFELMVGEIEKSQNPSEPAGGGKCSVM